MSTANGKHISAHNHRIFHYAADARHVYLHGCPSDDTVLDSGAFFSIIAEVIVTTCA